MGGGQRNFYMMAKNTMTLSIGGEVTLDDFAAAMGRFRALVDALTAEVAAGTTIKWIVEDLNAGSATATVRAVVETPEADPKVAQVVDAYAAVGRALETGSPMSYSEKVSQPASQLRTMLSKRIESLRFETADAESTLTAQEAVAIVPLFPAVKATFGTVEGRVQTLSNRGSLRFTLYDRLNDRPVSCYVAEGRDDLLRNIWGKISIVEGKVSRDRVTGRPTAVRQVTNIEVRDEFEAGSYRLARGVVPLGPKDPRPEKVIRRMRDA